MAESSDDVGPTLALTRVPSNMACVMPCTAISNNVQHSPAPRLFLSSSTLAHNLSLSRFDFYALFSRLNMHGSHPLGPYTYILTFSANAPMTLAPELFEMCVFYLAIDGGEQPVQRPKSQVNEAPT